MATNAQYTAQPIIETFTVGNTANTTRDGSAGTFYTLCAGPATAAANGVGKRILRVSMVESYTPVGAGTANVVRFYISTDGGTTKRLLAEKAIPAVTSSSTAIGFRTEVPELVGMVLPGAVSNAPTIYATVHSAAYFHVTIESGLL